MAGWSSLPGDLVNRIADRLLATDDLDYYMDLRAVCSGWRSSTADPKSDDNSQRFRPRQWVMLDEVFESDERLFVNPGTGRFVRRDLPLLRRYYFIAAAVGGSLVLAKKSAPHAARLLNPFTGSLTRFAAPVPEHVSFGVVHVIGTGCSPPTLVLFRDHANKMYWANPDSQSFSSCEEEPCSNPYDSRVFVGGIYAAACERGIVSSTLPPPEATKILTSRVWEQFTEDYFFDTTQQQQQVQYYADEEELENRCFLVESAGEILIVFKLSHHIEVFKMGDNMAVHPLKSIGRRALFIGNERCISVDADKFAAVDANSVYYLEDMANVLDDMSYVYHVLVYSLSDGTELCAGAAIGCAGTFFSTNDSPPFSVVQLLFNYAYQARRSQLCSEYILAWFSDIFSSLFRM